jgi:AbiU2
VNIEAVKWPPKRIDPRIKACRSEVKAAQEEFDLAVVFHEVWKPTAYDTELHKRMGTSFAANAFFVVRTALRREMLLALMRLWDKSKGSIRLDRIAAALRDQSVIDTLVAERTPLNLPEASDQIRTDLTQKRDAIVALIKKYNRGGSHWHMLEHLQTLRHERLAHRRVGEPEGEIKANTDDNEIEAFYNDMSTLIRHLMSLFLATAYDPSETGGVYQHHAQFFWAGVKGERTEGHPNYRATR